MKEISAILVIIVIFGTQRCHCDLFVCLFIHSVFDVQDASKRNTTEPRMLGYLDKDHYVRQFIYRAYTMFF
jgi:hypothetical protein